MTIADRRERNASLIDALAPQLRQVAQGMSLDLLAKGPTIQKSASRSWSARSSTSSMNSMPPSRSFGT